MVIQEVQTGTIRIPLARPFKTALRSVDCIDDILVRVVTDTGACGYGEAPPTAVITGDTRGSIVEAVQQFIGPAIIGMEIENIDGISERIHSCMVKNTSAKAAVDMAVYDLLGKRFSTPLYQLLGGYRRQLETDITISVNPVAEMVADSVDAVQKGFRILKIKVGKEGRADVERIAEIRRAVGPAAALRVDANQGWKAKDAVRMIAAMENMGLNIELVEQPVPAHDMQGMRYVTSRVSTPILADESLFTPQDAVEIIRTHAADLLNIKLMKTGGIYHALKICAIAEEYGVECMIGCMLESKLAVTAAAHLMAAKHIITRADLDGPSLCTVDPYEGGPIFKGPTITMGEGPGLGISGVPFEPLRS